MKKTDIISDFAKKYGLNNLLLQAACDTKTSHEYIVRELVYTANLDVTRQVIPVQFTKALRAQLKYEIEKFILENSEATSSLVTIVNRVKPETARNIEDMSIKSDIPKSQIVELAVEEYIRNHKL